MSVFENCAIITTKNENKSRVEVCALSAGWTGSCQQDEKWMLAVHISHPAAAHRQIYQFDIRIPSVRSLRTTAKEVFFYETIKTAVCRFLA